MPRYTRRFKRPIYKKRSYRKRTTSKKKFARFAHKVLAVGNEKKYIYNFWSPFSISLDNATPFIYMVNPIDEGDDETTRNGRAVYNRSLEGHFTFILDPLWVSGNPPSMGHIRVLVVQYLIPATYLTTSNVPSVQSPLMTPGLINSPYDHDTRRNWRILYDKKKMLSTSALAQPGVDLNKCMVDFDFKIHRIPLREYMFGNLSATTQTVEKGHIVLFIYTDMAVNATVQPVLGYQSCIKYNFSDK